jgi:cytochrome P450
MVMTLIEDMVKLAAQTAQDGRRLTGQLLGLLQQRLQQHPQEVFALLREVRPVYVHGGMAVVTRYPDVMEVLTHDTEFSVEGYAGPMREITGDFILGLDPGPDYERAVSLLRLAFRQTDVAAITALATQAASDCVTAALPSGAIDVIAELTDRVPARLVAQYLGAPGPDEDTLIRWARILFTHIFVDLNHDRILSEQATAAATAIRPHLDGLVAARKSTLAADQPVADDVLTRLLRQQALGDLAFTDVEIRSNLIGMLVGMIPTISKASALAIDELFRRPDQLDGARKAARDGDDTLFARYVTEAMRFAPQAPGLLRHAVADYPVARGTHHETLIRKGTVVFASTQSAMLDPDVIDDPHTFRLDRPDSSYLHFGAGLHTCYGRYVNTAVIPAIVKAALSIDGAVRAPGRAGQLTLDGTWPTTMTLHFPATTDTR